MVFFPVCDFRSVILKLQRLCATVEAKAASGRTLPTFQPAKPHQIFFSILIIKKLQLSFYLCPRKKTAQVAEYGVKTGLVGINN